MHGDGEFLGDWNTRFKGRKAYEGVINEWAQANKPAATKWAGLVNNWRFGSNKTEGSFLL
jgi:hypothetical protein